MRRSLIFFAVAALAGFGLVDCDGGGHHHRPNLVELAERLNLTKFVEALKETKISHVLNHEGHFTLFAPSDEAFTREKKYPQEATFKDKVLLHIGQGFHKSKDLANEMILKTIQSKRTIRLNVYDNGKTTANGRVISSFDHEARNGVIHVLDDVMSSVYKRSGSIVSELSDCCPEHSTMLELLKDSGLYDMLDETGPFTLLAPTNEGFAKLHPDFILHLKKNVTRLQGFMLGHVFPRTWYSAGLTDGMNLKTALGNKIPVTIDSKGVHFGKATVQLADVTAINGAVHSIDEVLFPRKTAAKTFKRLQSHKGNKKKRQHHQHQQQQEGGNDLTTFHHHDAA